MLVLLISECDGKAWRRTRRIADLYLERVGERTWRGRLTESGLRQLHDDLSAAASRHTSVACHRVATRQRFEIEWIVGSASPFNAGGQVATYCGHRYDSYLQIRSNPPPLWDVLATSASISGLWHDLGKANGAMQPKLHGNKHEADPVRHEVLSALALMNWFRQGGTAAESIDGLLGKPLSIPDEIRLGTRPSERALLTWLVATHHRLMDSRPRPDRWIGDQPLLLTHHLNPKRPWQPEPASTTLDTRLLDAELRSHLASLSMPSADEMPAPLWEALAAYGRLALVLADRQVSKQPIDLSRHPGGEVQPDQLLANTDGTGRSKQTLSEHLIKVSTEASVCVSDLHDAPRIAPALDVTGLPRPFRQKSSGRFAWQDRALDAVAARPPGGFFGVLNSGTGTGKTRAAAKIMTALRGSARFTVGNPLRTLTTQTGAVYRDEMGLAEADLAVIIGSSATVPSSETPNDNINQNHSAWSDEIQEDVDGGAGRWADLSDVLKRHIDGNPKALRILATPILVTTIDHLMPAADQRRTGFLIAALRLLTSDLILDDIDVFNERDLVAIGRLVHLAGIFGRNVILSSATLPPALVRSFWRSWRAGWTCHAALNGLPDDASFGIFSDLTEPRIISCGLYGIDSLLEQTYQELTAALKAKSSPRRALFLPHETARDIPALFSAITGTISSHHKNHGRSVTVAGRTNTLSLQLVHFAHVDTCVAYAMELERNPPTDVEVRYIVYHARHPLLVRSHIEKFLDRILRRDDNDRTLLSDPVIRSALLQSRGRGLAIVVIATGVEEIGRNHDFDAGIIEPTSVRSIIQFAGRILRLRLLAPHAPNLVLLPTTIRHIRRREGRFAYYQPGAEGPDLDGRWAGSIQSDPFTLPSPWLSDVLDQNAWKNVTAAPRLRERSSEALVSLEHARLAAFLEGNAFHALPPVWNGTMAWLSASHPEVMRFRAGEPRTSVWLEQQKNAFSFWQIEPGREPKDVGKLEVMIEDMDTPHTLLHINPEDMLLPYLENRTDDYLRAKKAARLLMVELPARASGWRYHPQFGLFRKMD